jgi:hypothetical protein
VTSTRTSWARRIVRVLPYVLTIAVIATLLSRYEWASISAAIAEGNVAGLFPIAFVQMLVSLALISVADRTVLAELYPAPRVTDVAIAKAASSLLDILGYAIGHGGYALWIARGCSERRDGVGATGALLYLMASDLLGVTLVATGALVLTDATAPEPLRIAAPAIAGALGFTWILGWFGRGRGPRVLWAWRVVRPGAAGIQLALRVTQMVMFSAFGCIAARWFGIDLPWSAALTYVPIILLVGALPINVAGFGAVQAAWLLLVPWAPAERILAFQLVWTVATTAAIAVRGLPFLGRWTAMIAR